MRHDPSSGSVVNVRDGQEAARQRVDVDWPCPEVGAVGAGEHIGYVAEVDLKAVACRKAHTGEVQNEKLGARRRWHVGEIGGPGVWGGRRNSSIRSDGESG